MRLLSHSVHSKPKHKGVKYSFVFMRTDGQQHSEITSMCDLA
jgi:hypothetical protein